MKTSAHGLMILLLASSANAGNIWSSNVSGSTVAWTTQNLTITSSKRSIFDARKSWEEDLAKMKQAAEDHIESQEDVELLSVVGPIVSYQDATYCDCGGAHPSADTIFMTLNTQHPDKMPQLTDFFPENILLAALLKDKVVQDALRASDHPMPKTLSDLKGVLYSLDNFSKDYRFDEAFLSHFAFHHIDGNKVAVRIGLPYATEVARGRITQIGLLLPIPESLKVTLNAAASQLQGFLMRNAPKGNTTFHYETKK